MSVKLCSHLFQPHAVRKVLILGVLYLLVLILGLIQPVSAQDTPTLQFSTYFGGSGSDTGINIAIDPNGYVYVSGATQSGDFPASNPLNVVGNHNYLTKFDPSGAATVYSILLPGFLQPRFNDIAADAEGAVYVVNSNSSGDAVITKINPAGTAIVYSKTLGGNQDDYAVGVVVDSLKNLYVVGVTQSTNFPTLYPYQNVLHGPKDVWLAKFNPAGTLVYSTYFGGTAWDISMDIAVDSTGNAYITGTTGSADFPVLHPYQSACVPTIPSGNCSDAFVAKFSPSGALLYSTYLGGDSDYDRGNAITVDALGGAYITGETGSTDFPTSPNAFQAALPGFESAFVTRLSPEGSGLVFSTYLEGTTDHSQGFGIVPDGAGGAYVSGQTWEADFPTTSDAYRSAKTGPAISSDAFLTRVAADGQSLLYSTFFGGSGSDDSSFDNGPRIALDPLGSLYIFGTTGSNDFPVLNALQSAPGGGSAAPSPDAFFAKFSVLPVSLPAQATIRNYFTTDTPTLTWTAIGGAMKYHIQVSKNSGFTGMPAFEGEVSGNTLSITTDSLPDGLYYWRVQAQKFDGTYGNWSPVESFTVDAN